MIVIGKISKFSPVLSGLSKKEFKMIKIYGFYKTNYKNEWVYIQKKKYCQYAVILVDITTKPDGRVVYSEDYDIIPKEELGEMIKDSPCYVPFRSRKYECFYAIWDGANKETFKYLFSKKAIEALGLKKHNYPENYKEV